MTKKERDLCDRGTKPLWCSSGSSATVNRGVGAALLCVQRIWFESEPN